MESTEEMIVELDGKEYAVQATIEICQAVHTRGIIRCGEYDSIDEDLGEVRELRNVECAELSDSQLDAAWKQIEERL